MNGKKSNLTVLLLLSPMIILLTLIILYPMISSANMSFYYYVLFDKANKAFIGAENYRKAFTDPNFILALKNTLKWVGLTLAVQFGAGLVFALILNKEFKGRAVIRSIVLIPWVTPGVVIALMWSLIYDGNQGVLNDILLKLCIINDKIPWLALPEVSLYAQIVALIWQGIPFFTIMILAALQIIPHELYESAKVDGSSSLQSFRYVTWPFILPTVAITVLLRIIWITNNVEIIYIMTQGGPGNSSLTATVYTYMQAQKALNFGYASTLAIIVTLFLSTIMFLYIRLLNRNGGIVDR